MREQEGTVHHDVLDAVAGLVEAHAHEPRTLGEVFEDVERRRALTARLHEATSRSALADDVRLALSRGWIKTFRMLAGEAIGIRLVEV